MRKAALLSLLALAVALPTLADDERHQSYLSYEDGGTVVRSAETGEEIDAHRNLPVYPGDEVVTARRGRAEVRLSDGNIIGVDRATALRFRSIVASYEGEGDETIVELKYGKVAVHRTDIGRDHVRLDTDNASYVAEREAVYSVETDARGADRVTVFDGTIEVRTPNRATRLRRGESANVDDRGVYDLIGDQRSAADEFERWFLKRAERFGSYNSRYMDRRLSYWSDDLDDHGRWVHVTGIGWSWRPFVSTGWRPYYNGYWHSRNGCLTWVSYDPWGWGTYHYGRWAHDPGYGWVWVPGYGYSPAWVYWTYGSGFVGWAPAGWWDCYRPYYNWAYQPYRGYTARLGFGFYGRVRLNELDLRPWTFIDSRHVVSNRVDRAALTADAVKQRLGRQRDGFVTVAGGPARFTREEWNDPADAIRRRSVSDRMGRNTGAESGAPPTDLTPFFRRDGDVAAPVRDRIARGRGSAAPGLAPGGVPSSRTAGGGTESVAPIGRGSVAPVGRGSVAPITPGDSGRVSRGAAPPAETPATDHTPSWRDRNDRGRGDRGAADVPAASPGSGSTRGSSDSWRSRVPRGGSGSSGSSPATSGDTSAAPAPAPSGGSSDVPRRVIDRIGGARVYPRDTPRASSGSGSGSSDRGRSTVRESSGGSSSRGDRGSSGGSSSRGDRGSSGGSVSRGDSGGSSSRSASPPPPPPSRDSGGSGAGRVERDQ